jgi:hypothetical protein
MDTCNTWKWLKCTWTSVSSNVHLRIMQHGTKGLSDYAGAAVFLHLRSGCRSDMKIMKNISTLSSSLTLSELKS